MYPLLILQEGCGNLAFTLVKLPLRPLQVLENGVGHHETAHEEKSVRGEDVEHGPEEEARLQLRVELVRVLHGHLLRDKLVHVVHHDPRERDEPDPVERAKIYLLLCLCVNQRILRLLHLI